MPMVSNDPAWWPFIGYARVSSYFVVARSAAVIFDWVLTFGQEFDLVWMHHWSLMTLLYVGVRYVGILYAVVYILSIVPVSMTDQVSNILFFMMVWMPVAMNAMLGVIMMTRIHAMYQGSKNMLIFLVVCLLASTIASGFMKLISNLGVSGVEAVLSGYHICLVDIDSYKIDLNYESFIFIAAWEILAFFLAVWIVVKYFREPRQPLTGSTMGDCFTMLTKCHAFYFFAFAGAACLSLGFMSPNITLSTAMGTTIHIDVFQISQVLQMGVLGPRLILSIREYHAKLVSRSDEGSVMTSIAFQAGGDALTGGDV